MPDIDPRILGHYAAGIERDRLADGVGQVEFLRTQELLSRVLPPPPAVVLDVGGGAGVHAGPLAARGFEVHLIDLVPLHIEQARAVPGLASVSVGDARGLDWPDSSVDVVLLLGPLYHLTERGERVRALAEGRRVLRPGGVVVAAAISRYASALDGLFRGHLRAPGFEAIVERDLTDGQHRNPNDIPGWFTTAYFHLPEELLAEAVEAELEGLRVLAVEGPVWQLPDLDRWLAEDRELLLRTIRRLESAPALLGASPHLLLMGHAMR